MLTGQGFLVNLRNIQLLQVYVKHVAFVGCKEGNFGLSDLSLSRKVPLEHEALDLLNCVDSIRSWHHKVCQEMAHVDSLCS